MVRVGGWLGQGWSGLVGGWGLVGLSRALVGLGLGSVGPDLPTLEPVHLVERPEPGPFFPSDPTMGYSDHPSMVRP